MQHQAHKDFSRNHELLRARHQAIFQKLKEFDLG
jgi:hypothetical protein